MPFRDRWEYLKGSSCKAASEGVRKLPWVVRSIGVTGVDDYHIRVFSERLGLGAVTSPPTRAPSIIPKLTLIPHYPTDCSVLERSKELDSANYMTWSLRSNKMETGYGVEKAASQLPIR